MIILLLFSIKKKKPKMSRCVSLSIHDENFSIGFQDIICYEINCEQSGKFHRPIRITR